MIKIIKKPKSKKYKMKCGCGCIFTFENSDIRTNNLISGTREKYVFCPFCEGYMNLDVWHHEEV